MKRFAVIFLCTCLFLLSAVPVAADCNLLKPVKITVDGNTKTVYAYQRSGTNFFKLRDVAMLLNGTPAQFAIDWDEKQKAVTLVKGAPYVASGGELAVDEKAKAAKLTTPNLLLEQTPLSCAAFSINGSNYIKLRDIAAAVNFGVDWDQANSAILIDSAKDYVALANTGSEVPLIDLPLEGKTICLDPGHGQTSAHKQEPIAPGSTKTKAAYVSGTSGRTYSEEQVNLAVALLLRQKLAAAGACVVMTREQSAVTLSNVERAQIANNAGADLMVRIHADGSTNTGVRGMSMLIPSGSLLGWPEVEGESARIGQIVLTATVNATGAQNRGLVKRSDLTGFNWSAVPVILIEMGFMTNAQDDAQLGDPNYQQKLAEGMCQGIIDALAER